MGETVGCQVTIYIKTQGPDIALVVPDSEAKWLAAVCASPMAGQRQKRCQGYGDEKRVKGVKRGA